MNACNVSSQQETRRPEADRHREDEMENAVFQMGPFCASKTMQTSLELFS